MHVAAWCSAPAASNGIPRSSRPICGARCTVRCPRRTTPVTACAWRWPTAPTWPTWARRGGCPIVQIPGDTIDGHQRSRSVRLERTRPRSIIVNRAGKRFLNEAGEYNSMAGPFHHLDPRFGYLNDPAWIVFDSLHLKKYGFLGIDPDGPSCPSGSASPPISPNSARRPASTPTGWPAPSTSWNANVEDETDPDFGRGSSAYDGYWGDNSAATPALQTLGPVDTAPYLRRPRHRRRDGHQGRSAHRCGRKRGARQRRTDPWSLRRGQCDGGRDRARPTAARAEPSAPPWCSATARDWRSRR